MGSRNCPTAFIYAANRGKRCKSPGPRCIPALGRLHHHRQGYYLPQDIIDVSYDSWGHIFAGHDTRPSSRTFFSSGNFCWNLLFFSPLLEIVFLSNLIFHPSRSMDFPCSNPDILMRINLFTERIARSWSRKRRVMEIGHCFKQINPLRYHVILKSRIYINVFHRIIDRIINVFHRIHRIWKRVKLRYIIKINYPIIFFILYLIY